MPRIVDDPIAGTAGRTERFGREGGSGGATSGDFGASRWHVGRHRAIVASHPEVVELAKPEAWTAGCIAAVCAAQIGLALWVCDAHFLAIVLLAYAPGGFLDHALGVLIHETAHNLVFRSTRANKALSLVANLPLLAPGAIDFRDKHLLHHRQLGEGPERDFQAPTPEAVRWVGSSRLRKLVWLSVGSLVFPKRPIDGVVARDPWRTVNLLVQLSFCVAILGLGGVRAVAYLALSSLFAFGPHPVGMRGYAEHVPLRRGQPTASYYGWMNWVAFNVGHHVEHHDFPSIPWRRLPRLRAMAAQHYRHLAQVRSWGDLLIAFLFGQKLRVDSYVVEPDARR